MGHQVPEMTPVVSSNVESIGHDGKALYVRFKSGGTYRYAGAPADHLAGMIASESPGRYFRANIQSAFGAEKV